MERRMFFRFWSKVLIDDGCWLWTAGTFPNGYGMFGVGTGREQRKLLAHRAAYECLVGPIPEGLVLDHVADRGCTSKACVNPAHLEPVTQKVNLARGSHPGREKTHCAQGHPYDESNTYWRGTRRYCRACGRKNTANYFARKIAQ